MNPAKQTAMDAYGFTEWPGTHLQTQAASNVRSTACLLLRKEGLSLGAIAKDLGFCNEPAVRDSINQLAKVGAE